MLSSLLLYGYGYVDSVVGWTIFIYIIIYLGGALGFGFGTRAIATSKGYSDTWFWFGFFCWGVGLIVAACMQPTAREMGRRMEMYSTQSGSRSENIKPGSWRCACGQINQSFTGTCSCGREKASGTIIGVASNTVAGTRTNPNSKVWLCPDCGRQNLRYVSTCECGCTYEKYLAVEKSSRQRQHEADMERIRRTEEIKKAEEELIGEFKKLNLSDNEMLAIRMLSNKDARMSLLEMCQKIPRSAVIADYKEAVEKLENSHLIEKDAEGKYYLAIRPDEDNVSSDSKFQPADNNVQANETVNSPGTEKKDIDKYDEIRKFKELLDEGIISEEEFNQKKKELLGL